MKAVLLTGDFGTRIGEETMLRPKPVIELSVPLGADITPLNRSVDMTPSGRER
ncbi:hypothetical protein [Luteibacter sp. CQ10]|uniref:hypothetical protein n=1 Tax=Luteibacter sp. CQ10 TaxID=2805821 RepID=UPI0034A43997